MEEILNELRRIGVRPNKDLGQNFLCDPFVVSQIVDFANVQKGEQLLEIGPGLGALTIELAATGCSLGVIEIERRFCDYLRERLPKIRIYNTDVRMFDFSQFPGKVTVFGNLPYSFSSEIILQLLSSADHINRAIVMLQKEFAERLFASPGTGDYGILSVLTQLKADVLPGPVIGGQSFYPPPDVQSQVIQIRFFESPRYNIKDNVIFQQLLRGLFRERRKKISNTIKKAGFDPLIATAVLQGSGVDPNLRPQDVTVADYVKLANLLAEKIPQNLSG